MSLSSRACLVALACLGSATPALAGPTVGAAIGMTETKGDAANGDDANTTVGLFVRGRVFRNLSVQGEVSKIDTDSTSSTTIRSGAIAAILDLTRGHLVPFVLAAGGVDLLSPESPTSSRTYVRGEVGVGLEYRFAGGLVLGADARIGTRTEDGSPTCCFAAPVADGGPATTSASHYRAAYVASESLSEGEYRSARVTLGVHF